MPFPPAVGQNARSFADFYAHAPANVILRELLTIGAVASVGLETVNLGLTKTIDILGQTPESALPVALFGITASAYLGWQAARLTVRPAQKAFGYILGAPLPPKF